MKLLGLSPMLWTKHLNLTVGFYTNILKFTCDELNEKWGFASLSRDNVQIMLAVPKQHPEFKEAHLTGSIYIHTDEVDKLWKELKDKVEVVYPVDNFEHGMREFAIYDNNRYTIQFGQEIDLNKLK
jgi:catechol 2,3-dioxygenase-like lactoylglutathione lyase family enzyme